MLFSHWRLAGRRPGLAPAGGSPRDSNHFRLSAYLPPRVTQAEDRVPQARSVPRRALGLLLSIAVFAPHALSDDKVIPKNGCGIDWKTVDQAKVKVKLSNGEEVTSQPTWAAFGPA